MEYRYRAIRVRQSGSDKRLVLFSAKAPDIRSWAGVPQKKKFGEGAESGGFQREENPLRVDSLRKFYGDQENIIQNPLLCALREIPPSVVSFEPDPGQGGMDDQTGVVCISLDDLDALSLEECFARVRKFLEGRVAELATREPSPGQVQEIRQRARDAGLLPVAETEASETDGEESTAAESDEETAAESVVFEESHIYDFWEEVAARHVVLREIRESGVQFTSDELLGFDRAAMLSYLKPVVLVDGQHRLSGALRAAEATLDTPVNRARLEEAIAGGQSAVAVTNTLIAEAARSLPVSLLMSSSPAEQVFQFIIVNQKATPIGKSLLGTIVSTSLANEELDKVAGRLKNAGIKLEESQAITYLSRLPESPFFNLIERGLAGDARDLLQWSVFGSLISIVRDLSGGVLFGEKNDYAARWRNKQLEDSGIVADFATKGFDSAFDYWKSPSGPWRDVFIRFWSKVRDEFGDTTDPDRHNYWGRPRNSNLFNKVSLTILSADFFQFLVETRQSIGSADDIPELVELWLEDVDRKYFDKDWQLSGVKKDSTGIRNRWASNWSEYRKSPERLPDKRTFRSPKSA